MVCGGAVLIVCGLVTRLTTRDVDVVALRNETGLITPDPFPMDLKQEAEVVGANLDLPEYWINNGPSREPGGLFQVGLPDGIESRLQRRDYGERLAVFGDWFSPGNAVFRVVCMCPREPPTPPPMRRQHLREPKTYNRKP